MKKIILLVIMGLGFYIGLQQPVRAESSLISVHSNGDWQNPIIKTGVKLPIADFTILANSPSVAWRQISIHVLLSNGLTASNWILQDNSNTAYTSDVTAVQNGGVITFTAPVELPLYNNTAGVGYSVYATITGDVTSAPPTIITKFIDSSDFVLNGSYVINGLPTTPQTRGNICTSWTYSSWSACSNAGKQTRIITSSSPSECVGGNPMISQSCKQLLPKITSISPVAINQGDFVDVIGENFGKDDNGSLVITPGGQRLETSNWTATKISVHANITDPNDWFLIVKRSHDGTGNGPQVDSNTFPIKKLQQRPKIISITPNKINPKGDTVTITGENFGATQSTYSGKFYDNHHVQGSHQILSWSDTSITAIINFADRNWLEYSSPRAGIQVRVKCLDSICKNYGGAPNDWKGPKDEYWSETVGINLNVQTCTEDKWSCSEWDACSVDGKQSRKCTRTVQCGNAEAHIPPAEVQTCKYTPPCYEDKWSCGDWNSCSADGKQSRTCIKSFDCPSVNTLSPNSTQSCVAPRQQCFEDKWECGSWNACSPSGIQSRSCRKTYDCPDVESEIPQTAQYCQAPQQQQAPQSDLPTQTSFDQSRIIKSTVKLVCPLDSSGQANQGTGTIIDSKGTILTNKHVVSGTLGCLVGFVNSAKDEPYFSDRQIADITRVSSDEDIATVTLRNPGSRQLTFMDIGNGSSNRLHSASEVTAFGYPARFGTNLTFTRGYFSGYDGNYLRTTAILEHGNSGGGAYLNEGMFVGIPSKVAKGELNSMGFLLSIDKINSWLKGTPFAYNGGNSGNNYARVSEILDTFDLSGLKLYDISGAKVALYKDTAKTEILSNNIGTENTAVSPLFQISNVKDASGYYVYFGDSVNIDPATAGTFISTNEYSPKPIAKDGTYYFIFKARNNDDAVSDAFITEYRYKKNTQKNVEKKSEKRGTSRSLGNRLRGSIVLQVESHGEAYYINPDNEKRYSLGRPADAFTVMRGVGLGVTHDFITRYIKRVFPDRVVGKILIDVGDHGKAYYIYPKNKKAYYLGRPADAFKVMRELGLGISNRDLEKIEVK